MKIYTWAVVLLTILFNRTTAQSFQDTAVTIVRLDKPDYRAYDELQLPVPGKIKPVRQVIVAIVDDAFSLTHHDLQNFYYHNNKEIPGNGIDEDKNGYIDDVMGWDAADNDNDVSIPPGRESFFYHGTMVAGIIANVAKRCLGSKASDYVKILPVKAMLDKSQKPYLEYGYEGIDYAVRMGADIIVCAWSGGKFDKARYQHIFDEAQKKGILIIASGGNFFSERTDPPASVSSVYAVAAIDTALKKTSSSNYGSKIDLVAAGQNVYTAHPLKDDTHFYGTGTSSAAALAGACAAMLKVADPAATPRQIFAALKNTALPLDSINKYYGGKLGAGLPQLTGALNYLLNKKSRSSYFNSKRSTGEIILDQTNTNRSWQLNAAGGYKSFTFTLAGKVKGATKQKLEFYTGDSLFAGYLLNQFPFKLEIPGGVIKIIYSGKSVNGQLILNYSANPVDSATLYCSGTKYITSPSGVITDGSGPWGYAGNCDCKWLITVPEGKHVHLEFDRFDTEAKTDFVWIFQGDKTLPENLIAKFSGPELPPVITSAANQVLVWFVTDNKITGKGWQLKYSETDNPPGVTPATK